jgi:hypothetical protein
LTRKERVRAAIQHHEPDVVPVGEWIIDYEPASLVLGRETFVRGKARLAHALWKGRRDEVVDSIKRDLVELIRRLDLDIVCVDLTWPKGIRYQAPRQVDPETWRDKHGNVFRYSDLTRDLMLLEQGDAGWEPPRPPRFVDGEFRPHPTEMEIIQHVLAELGDSHFVFTGMGDAHLPIYTALDVEPGLLRLAEDPEGVAAGQLASYQSLARRLPFFARLGFDAVIVGQDYGFNSGPFMSPETFRRIHFPALQHICQATHDHGMFLICHSCGNLRLILPLMIEAGIDVYQAIQPIEDIAGLKRDFGRHLCLWGGVSNHDLVLSGPDDIRRQVKHAMGHCAPGGGFILGTSHSVTVRTPLPNIIAYLEAAGRHPQPASAALSGKRHRVAAGARRGAPQRAP